MFKKCLSILFLAFSFAVFAGSTTYVGAGEGVFVQTGRVYPCEQIFFSFTVKQDKFSVSDGGYICGLLQASYDPFSLTIIDGKLYLEDQVVGDISDSELNLFQEDATDNSSFHLNLRFSHNELEYTEVWEQDGLIQLEIKGKLLRR